VTALRWAAVAAAFDRDLDADFARIEKLVGSAREQGVQLLALPEAALGGY
jgi:N-carbamoylputrescine amidase